MRLISLLTNDGTVLHPVSDGRSRFVATDARIATGNTHLLMSNIERPGKLPVAGDTITLRHVNTNRLLALTRYDPTSLYFSDLQTDVQAERFNALLVVTSVRHRVDGLIEWRLEPESEIHRGALVDVVVWDHTVGARIGTSTNAQVRLSGTMVTSSGPGSIVRFHLAFQDHVFDLRGHTTIWMSCLGERMVVETAPDGAQVLRAQLLSPGPLTGMDSGTLFEVIPLDRAGLFEPGDRFRLKRFSIPGFSIIRDEEEVPEYVMVRDGRLVVEPNAANAESGVFSYEPLEQLNLYWNGESQDNAIAITTPGTDYMHVRPEAQVFLAPQVGTVPIRQFYSTARRDTITTATVAGAESAFWRGYGYRGIIGYACAEARPNMRLARQYWHGERADHLWAATRATERSAGRYGLSYDDCYVFPPRVSETADRASDTGDDDGLPHLVGVSEEMLRDIIRGGRVDHGRDIVTDIGVHWQPIGERSARRALVLSGGGAKGAFEAGAIQELYRRGYRPDIICGVSVGAINAGKLAEGPDAVSELVQLWRELSSDPQAVFLDELYARLLGQALDQVGGSAGDIGWAIAAAKLFGYHLSPAEGLRNDLFGIAAGLIAAESSDLSDNLRRLINLATMTHSIHSMEPLRRQILQHLHPERIVDSGITLRVGISDIKSGNYFSVTEPFANSEANGLAFDREQQYGLVEPEPDKLETPTWLSQPVFGCDYYAMRLVDAIYASSTMPVYMEPLYLNLHRPTLLDVNFGRVGLLNARLPPGIRRLLNVVAPTGTVPTDVREPYDFADVQAVIDEHSEWSGLPQDDEARAARVRLLTRLAEDQPRGPEARRRMLLDGGIIDAIPIRTALRLGATEILVIGVDQLYASGANIASAAPITQYSWIDVLAGGDFLGGVDPMGLPAVRYLLSAMEQFIHGTTRMDMLAAFGSVDTRRLVTQALGEMSQTQRSAFLSRITEALDHEAKRRRSLFGAAGVVGGYNHDDYGSLTNGTVKIDVILPDCPLLGALDFSDAPGVEEALELGRIAARSPVAV